MAPRTNNGVTDAPFLPEEIESASWNLTDVDRMLLKQTDEEYEPHGWEELKTIVAKNQLDLFKRLPSHLRRYLRWSVAIKAEYNGILPFICKERLHWEYNESGLPFKNPIPFGNTSDYCIRLNDWPYGVAPGIRHLVVWLKTPFPVGKDGELTPESRARIETFVSATFVQRLVGDRHPDAPEDRVLWFKNWAALQSVSALEHFHVMVRDVDIGLLQEWVGKDHMETIA
ncbi:hypothetical protein GRF29_103g1780079 [Pseudopithomyces chartarum]|uniref:N-acetylglucosamine-induced protein 1 n=1 Tax=Pseudopithomyces chartarum TaxID=1892770 RepID=A0AAN6RHS2_9PLEO|nr:hypothetical protein GRF29_103g1780079 [Pseudopithomyces chartarum]